MATHFKPIALGLAFISLSTSLVSQDSLAYRGRISDTFRLDANYDFSRLSPKDGSKTILASKNTRFLRVIDTRTNDLVGEMSLSHNVEAIEIGPKGRFAYVVGVNPNDASTSVVSRVDLERKIVASVAVQHRIERPSIALEKEKRLFIASQGMASLIVIGVGAFDSKPPARISQIPEDDAAFGGADVVSGDPETHTKPFIRDAEETSDPALSENTEIRFWRLKDGPVFAMGAASSENLLFFSHLNSDKISAIAISSQKSVIGKEFSTTGNDYNSLALTVIDRGSRPGSTAASVSIIVGSQLENRILVFDYDPAFRSINLVSTANIPASDYQSSETANGPGEISLSKILIASDKNGSSIGFGYQGKNSVTFLKPAGRGLEFVTTASLRGELNDIDISDDGSVAVILSDSGSSLTVINNPGIAPATEKLGEEVVREVQRRLSELDYRVGVIDGVIGKQTSRAIKLFQQNFSIPETGELNDVTLTRLRFAHELKNFRSFFSLAEIRNFSPEEIFFPQQSETCAEQYEYPPRETWSNLMEMAIVLDEFRERWRHPVLVHSIYKSPAYFKCMGVHKDTSATQARTVEFSSSVGKPKDWIKELDKIREEGRFHGKTGTKKRAVQLSLHNPGALWIYLGKETKTQGFTPQSFDKRPLDRFGAKLLSPTNPVNIRLTSPFNIGNLWLMGEKVGVLSKDMLFSPDAELLFKAVNTDQRITEYYWAGGDILPYWYKKRADRQYWFVVIGTFSNSQREKAFSHAEELRIRHPYLSLEVYETEKNLFKVVAGSNLSQGEAKYVLRHIQRKAISETAYMEAAKKWGKAIYSHRRPLREAEIF